ncbi:NAD(P)-binding protein [Hypoxylon trugodes]|uniref:NAD(P)-binding protein n=1 Tax=Hypoxylon trugodes TaxID=326681 RepID=UPI00219E0089|nr:NAD(P)-binding protein [Hypoxylon trugodes]KAI1390566.1 NAD(P)-binding protein [Hypoxylon trugodes]
MPDVAEAQVFPVLKGKVAIVTGAAQGMGRATAEIFLKAGAKVVMCDIKEKECQEVAEELSRLGDVIFVKADISKSADVQNLVNKTVAEFGRLDAAVNNAALTPDSTPLIDFDEDYWNKIMNVDLTGPALCCKYEMQQMIKQGGKGTIVNIGSVNSFKPQPRMPAYTSAKHAIIGLTKHASIEGGPHGIRVNAIAPGPIYSKMSADALITMGTTEEEFVRQATTLFRFGIGAAIVRNLASKGCNIIVNHATASSDQAASELCEELEVAHGVKAIWVRADISKREECDNIVKAAKTHFANPETGKLQIDIIIHNAGIGIVGPLEDVVEEDFQRMYAVNVMGPILLTSASLPYLPTDRSGRIVMMSSVNSKVGTRHTSLYSGTKGALEAMARVWCHELAERATVNTINPGAVMTDMYLSASDAMKDRVAVFNSGAPLVALRPCDTPEVRKIGERFGGRAAYDYEIAGMVAILCSPEAGWCTGSIISANGGVSFSY